ncbi:glycosyltransferase family 39 protein [Paraburkholderia unamae]|uniref:4-amino-4-deoxy-L-arabinose transferase-like glycosyltransferase n=1 Tax=Paraburkholderia unamae TaxID=219649 RepID=A0ABX5KMZ1_9BURK|nr:glycosyltransferase family 39 protein [Paraburkholderia unamae]PVX82246.1 4-amino-4-deoxy-L-arabinose transferase-like glycosyltransferase [Paraburkholderia unamae]
MDTLFTTKPLASERRDYAAILLPVAIWLVAVIAADPRGNIPLNDDWSYALTVRTLLETGQFTPGGYTSMTLIGQTLWGALFCLPFGFSYTALRISTIVAGAIGLGAFALLLQDAGCDRRKTIAATLVLGFNPIWLVLSVSFMTDIQFAAYSIVATMFFCRFLRTRKTGVLLAAIVFALAAVSVRQLGLNLAMAMCAALLLESRKDKRAIALSASGVAASVAFLVGFVFWLHARDAVPAMASAPTDSFGRSLASLHTFAMKLEQFARGILVHMGWFLCPVLLWRAPQMIAQYKQQRHGRRILIGAAVFGLVWFGLMAAVRPLPLDWVTINDGGLGPVRLHSAPGTLPGPAPLPKAFWLLMTFIAVGGATLMLLELGLVVRSLLNALRKRQFDGAATLRAFLLFNAVIYLAPLFVAGYFDRYLLVPTFALLALFTIEWQGAASAEPTEKARKGMRTYGAAAMFALVLTGAYGVAGTHDYMSWNRARWSLLDTLLNRGVKPAQIDGGEEFNGTYLYDPNYVESPTKSFWWVIDDEYLVQFGGQDGYHTVASVDVDGWLPNFRTQLLALRRDPR